MIPQSDGMNVQLPQSATTPRRLTLFFFQFLCSSNLYNDIAWRTYSFITLNTGTGCFPSNTLINIWIVLTCVKSFFDVVVMISLVSMTSMVEFCEQGVVLTQYVQCNLDFVTLLVSTKTVTKSHNVTKSIDFM